MLIAFDHIEFANVRVCSGPVEYDNFTVSDKAHGGWRRTRQFPEATHPPRTVFLWPLQTLRYDGRQNARPTADLDLNIRALNYINSAVLSHCNGVSNRARTFFRSTVLCPQSSNGSIPDFRRQTELKNVFSITRTAPNPSYFSANRTLCIFHQTEPNRTELRQRLVKLKLVLFFLSYSIYTNLYYNYFFVILHLNSKAYT